MLHRFGLGKGKNLIAFKMAPAATTKKKTKVASPKKSAVKKAASVKASGLTDIEDLVRPERLITDSDSASWANSTTTTCSSTGAKKTTALRKTERSCTGENVHDVDAIIASLRESLLEWFDQNRRLLPWRGDQGEYLGQSLASVPADQRQEPRKVAPYETWVSEIMLQQTRVETVIDYFKRWMERFPTPHELAKATPDEVNASWAGLGYYRRARNLHAGAQTVSQEYNGDLPSEVKDLLKIQGIGAYTAGAVASIAFGRAVPLVDGNVIRVFSRLCAVKAEAKDAGLIKGCWSLAQRLVDPSRPGDFNQALMELGATVCKPRNPQCDICPAQKFCRAYAEDPTTVQDIPLKAKAKVLPVETYAVGVLERTSVRDGENLQEFLMAKRPAQGLLAGQWEFLLARSDTSDPTFSSRQRLIDSALGEGQIPIAPCRTCLHKATRQDRGMHEHTFSHLQHRLHVESIVLPAICKECQVSVNDVEAEVEIMDDTVEDIIREFAWLTTTEMRDRGMTASMTKCLALTQDTAGANKTKGSKKRKAQTSATDKTKKEINDKKQSTISTFFGAGKVKVQKEKSSVVELKDEVEVAEAPVTKLRRSRRKQ